MKRTWLAWGALMAASGGAWAQQDPTGSWASETSAEYFARGGCVTDGTFMYVFGGYQLGVTASYPSYYRQARRYDPSSGEWVTLAGLPIVVSNITYQYNAGAYYDGRLYSFGTSYDDGNGIVLSYSIATNAWTVLSGVTLPGARYGAAAAVLNDRIYVAGGFSGTPSPRVDAFNPFDNTFTRVADLPVGLHLHAMAALPARGSLYVVGGRSESDYESGCYEYSPSANTWTTRAPMAIDGTLRPRGYVSAFALRNRIYVSGGRSDAGTSPAVFEYTPAFDTWAQRASLAEGRYQHGAVAIGGRGFVYGGLPVYSNGEEFTPPDFGPAPDAPAGVAVAGSQAESSRQATPDREVRDGWTGAQVSFLATVSDPDPAQLVRLRVRVRPSSGETWTELDSGLCPQGQLQVPHEFAAAGEYDWEYRVEDADGNSVPEDLEAWLPAYGNEESPDLRVDLAPPAEPVGLSPKNLDVASGDATTGRVRFAWLDSMDDGPAAGIVHDVVIGLNPGILNPEVKLELPAGEGEAWVTLSVLRSQRWWRIRARDIAGNPSAWSEAYRFNVTWDDGFDHAAGDGRRVCGFGATSPAPGPGVAIPAALLVVASSIVYSLRRRNP